MLCSERDIYAFARQLEGDALIVALNLSRDTRNVSLPVKGLVGDSGVMQAAWDQDRHMAAQGILHDVKLAPRSRMVLIA